MLSALAGGFADAVGPGVEADAARSGAAVDVAGPGVAVDAAVVALSGATNQLRG